MVKGLKTLFCAVERAGSKVIFTGLQANKQGILLKSSVIKFILLKLLVDQLEYLKIIAGVVAVIVYVSVRLFAGYTLHRRYLRLSLAGACEIILRGLFF